MQNETKNDQEKVPDVKRQGWNVEEVSEESVNLSADEITRQVLRGDETKGDANERDIVGGVNPNDTPQGREEAKVDEKEARSKMVDDKLAQDEAMRVGNYEAIKSGVKSEVGGEIAAEAERPTVAQAERIDHIAGDMRRKAVNEVVETGREVERGRTLARVSQIVDYVFFVIYGLLIVRLLLELFAARESAGFVKFIKSATGLLYAPFQGIMPSPSKDGFTLALPIIVAIVVYMLVHFAINGLLRIFAHRKTAI